jgi:hypothetical protein
MQCCCGKYDFDTDSTEDLIPVVFNDTMHEVLGPEGHFCGPVHLHTIRNLERKIEAQDEQYQELIAQLHRDIAELRREKKRLREALKGILECGKRDLTNPKYDGYFKSARKALGGAE